MFGIDYLVDSVVLPILNVFYTMTNSYGWAIILVTVTLKAALMPLTFKQIRATFEMQKIQPKLKKLQEKYKSKPEVYNKKMMEFYKENKVNPLGGCLPLIIQMPFLIALYSALLGEKFKALIVNNNAEKAFFFIEDLTRSGLKGVDGIHIDNLIMLAIFGLSTFLSQKMMISNPNDPMQKNMLFIMPIMVTSMFAFIPLPSGVFLYIVVSNLFTIGQNFAVLNQKKKLEEDHKKNKVEDDDENEEKDQKKNNNINLDKKNDLSPALATNIKSKRAKKKRKKNKKR